MDTPTKRCNRCGQLKPLREFHRRHINPDGHHNTCKLCRSNREGFGYKPSAPEGFKRCSVCEGTFPLTSEYFYSHSGIKDGFNPACKTCVKARLARRDPVVVSGYKQAYRKRHPERVRLASWNHWNKNREKYRAYYITHKAEHNRNGRNWYYANLDYARQIERLKAHRYRARKLALPDTFTLNDWQRALDYFNGQCAYCGCADGVLCAEHFVPLTAPNCPGTVPENIVPACKSCNSSKRDREPFEWLRVRFPDKHSDIAVRVTAYFATTTPPVA